VRRALHAEWTKLRTVPSTGWLLLALVASTVATSAMAVWAAGDQPKDAVRTSLSGVYLGQIAVVVLAALCVTTEYESGMIRTTFAAHPRRAAVFAAKAIALTAIVAAAGLVGTLGSLLAGRAQLPGGAMAASPALRAAGGTVLYLCLSGLLGLGLAVAARHTAAALSAPLAVLYLPPILTQFLTDEHIRRQVLRYSPMPAGLAVQATNGLAALPIGPWPGIGVLAAYAGAALALGAALFVVRDA
jgi:ABC-2 type transport system permease protein